MAARKASKKEMSSGTKKISRSGAGPNMIRNQIQGNQPGGEDAHGILEGISSLHSWIKTQTMIRPTKLGVKHSDSGGFSDDEEEDVVISLTSRDPNVSVARVRWDNNMGEFVPLHFTETMIDHLEIDSVIHHVDSDEARAQAGLLDTFDESEAGGERRERRRKDSGASEQEEEAGPRKIANQFSFIERATQTLVSGNTSTEVQTEPPPRANFSETVNQWVIFDFYEQYEKMKELEDKPDVNQDELRSAKPEKKKKIGLNAQEEAYEKDKDVSKRILRSAKVLERMLNLNTFWEDQSDEFKDIDGSLLPLWRFSFEAAKNLEITSLCWNPKYNDLFAASLGSYDFYKQATQGFVCMFSLKNPSYPEFLCQTHCGVMSCDIHPYHPHMLVVGLYDGSVAVYNLQQRKNMAPNYMSSATNGKHTDVVWQVKWVRDNLDGYLNFYSVSGDGRVTNWTLVKNCLWHSDQLTISFAKQLTNLAEAELGKDLMDSGRSIAFKPDEENLFLAGTEEGSVHLATTQYSSQYLRTYLAHSTPVYNIQWNTFVPNIFVTCAAEFVLKIWHKDSTKPILRLDLGSQIGDVAWAPYSSTVLAAVTSEGKVFVFDLDVNKYKPICIQSIVSKKQGVLNHIAFNKEEPILLVGDSRGIVHSLKLSPNLRKRSKEAQKAIQDEDMKEYMKLEVKKLDQLLTQVIEANNDSMSN